MAEVLNVLGHEIGSEASASIRERAARIIENSVDPAGGIPDTPSDGLLYGLIQSGKTSIITVAAAMAVDNGFRCIVILTSDIDLLYEQTLDRVRESLQGLEVLGKNDWRDAERFNRKLRAGPVVIVCSKNGYKLNSLLEAFRSASVRGLSAMIIDDEADQASLNTFTSNGDGRISRINEVITNLRNFFGVNTYLQVTATPQALFLQRPDHRYHPAFTVLSQPGHGYVGGEAFFGPESQLLRPVDLTEVNMLLSTHQPAPTGTVPRGLKQALYTFLVGAAVRVIQEPGSRYAFLCHVSVNTRDHQHILRLIDRFKEQTSIVLRGAATPKYAKLIEELREAYNDLSHTQPRMPAFDQVLEKIKFYLNGANVRLVNASSNEEIRLNSVYNIFVGGNKLGRGVTIKNLLVSYYGRNPRRPNADTVLQHARMYGYRADDLGVTRLFLPDRLAEHFKLIHQMEIALRELVNQNPSGRFEGIYVSAPLQATRRNVLDPNSLGMYIAGSSYNPSSPLRNAGSRANTAWLDMQLESYDGNSPGQEVTIDFIISLIKKCPADPTHDIELWHLKTIEAALEEIKTLKGNRAYLVIRRGRSLNPPRRETQGIISGGEDALAPKNSPTLFLYRQNESGEIAFWWPQLRFPDGNYALAFSFNR